jgi:ATP-dependent RNA helicase RhlE
MRCLILTPTRELASQIEDNIKQYAAGLSLTSTVVFGGVGARPQIKALSKGIDIVTATPGRLLDLMGDGYISLDQIETFVLDEADRMLDMGFIHDVKKIISKLPEKRQTLLFSATMPKSIERLSQSILRKPKRVEVTPESTTVEKIDQKINFVERLNKPLLLKNILKDKGINHALVFTKTKHGANHLVKKLDKYGIVAAAIHGNKSQGAREKALNGFRNGDLRVLVATDIAARGIDVASITHVINYNLPDDPKSYVHRIGRTARAGREGIAISFCDPSEKKLLKDIERCINYSIPVDKSHEFHYTSAESKTVKPVAKTGFRRKKKRSYEKR